MYLFEYSYKNLTENFTSSEILTLKPINYQIKKLQEYANNTMKLRNLPDFRV